MLAWIDATAGTKFPIFGLTLVERHLHALKKLPVAPSRIIVDFSPGQEPPQIRKDIAEALPIELRRESGTFSERLALVLALAGTEPILLLDGSSLADSRLHAALARLPDSVVAFAPKDRDPIAMIRLDPGLVTGRRIEADNLFALGKTLVADGSIRIFRPDEFNGFIRKLRRTIPFYMFQIGSPAKAAKVERFMFWSNYKGSTDFFTRYVYPPLVWLCVRPLARAKIHPNLVTVASIILALGAIPFWANGQFAIGFFMAYGMSVLDSVDGKLARLTFTDSELGNILDHGLDLIHPPFWYLSWAYGLGLSEAGWASPLGLSAILVMIFYVVDRLILKIYPLVFKRAFHTHSKLDGRVRTFIARRNITLPIFLVGYILGWGVAAFHLIALWQIATVLYHGLRTFWILAIEKAHLKEHQPTDVATTLKDPG